jgi:hypothetical protein
MNPTDLVCLANSRKLNGLCFAGRQLLNHEGSKAGPWIRPVGRIHTQLLPCQQVLEDGSVPDLLDIVRLELEDHVPRLQHCEDYLLGPAKWRRVGRFPQRRLGSLLQTPQDLWLAQEGIVAPHKHDRIPETETTDASLYLISVDRLTLTVEENPSRPGKFKTRAHFGYRGVVYDLAVTDIQVTHSLETGVMQNPTLMNDVALCISLSEPFQGYVYKLVAAVLFEERFK